MNRNILTRSIIDAIATIERRVFAAADGDLPAIKPMMILRPVGSADNEYELLIYGDIGDSWWGESVTAQSIVQQLAALPAGVTQLNVRINSYGGSVSDGMAIYNVLKRNSAKKIGTVDGVAMSSASLIAMACDTLNMPEASLLMIHAPWGLAQGNATDMRIMADVLDTYAGAMSGAYAAKTGLPKSQMLSLLMDGQDHFYTGEQAVEAKFADAVIAAAVDEDADDTDASARARNNVGLSRYLSSAPAPIAAMAIAASRRSPKFAASAAPKPAAKPAAKPAVTPTKEENTMTPEELAAKANADADNAAARVAAEAEATKRAQGALRDRNERITAALKPVMKISGVSDLYTSALADPEMTIDQVHAKALALCGKESSPIAGTPHIEGGEDQREKDASAMCQVIVARSLKIARNPEGKKVAAKIDDDNPFRKLSLSAMAEHCVRAAGHNTARLSRSEIAALALSRPMAAAGHTTSDFTTLLGNSINRVLLATYENANVAWRSFCKITDLADFRVNQRLRMGSFDDLKVVNEAGNYEQGTLSDASAETIQAGRKGRKLVVSREMIVNDDLQAFADMSTMLGNAASRTVEKDVFALLALNSGNGPTMGDGAALFDSTHNNIAATPSAPTVLSFDAARQQLAQQKDISGNDFLDIQPSIWLGPNSLYGAAQLLNINETDPTINKFQVRNIVAAMLDKVIGTPRLSGTPWYVLADPDIERVFEVGFIDGNSTPRIDSVVDFDSDGVKWKVVLEYGVAATGWRGIVKNAGA